MQKEPMDLLEKIRVWVAAGELSETAGEQIALWLTDPRFAASKEETRSLILAGDLNELEDAYRARIEFGTGGIRGPMGPGPNRINLRTVGEAAQGVSRYVLKSGADAPRRGVVIAYDTRINSQCFANEVAAVFAGNGIRASIFESCRSSPQLSYSVRSTGAVAGVVISASHNPPGDNGVKVYWSDGGQVVPPHDGNIIAEVNSVSAIKRLDFNLAVEAGLIRMLDRAVDTRYHRELAGLTLRPERQVRVIYSPLHGVGLTSVMPALESLGYGDLRVVPSQANPDGNFPTVPDGVANPEDPRVLAAAVREAAETDADLVIASDPDADRLGCAVPDSGAGWNAPLEDLALNGNQIGAVLCHYILDQKKSRRELPDDGIVAKTIVTTDLTAIIARAFGATVVDDLLVGFKYIGSLIADLPAGAEFLFGAEESHGYLAGTFTRDKDAAVAAVLLCECAATLKARGRTLRDYLDEIYTEYGYFREIQRSVLRSGAQGRRDTVHIMESLRSHPPRQIGGCDVVEIIDRRTGQAMNPRTGSVRTIEGLKGDVIAFTFTSAGHTRVTARPSGTEPKIKYYVSAASVDHPRLCGSCLEETKNAIDGLALRILSGIVDEAESRLDTGDP
ncbi:MAG: phospho-sugar mutase [Gemmatimonadota bacterium]|nr:phospho-sugar mutase [Gemmatimonadota bacterium]